MTDHFARFQLPRRPWLDDEALKTKFLALSSELHPDRAHGDENQRDAVQTRYTELNAAYSCLRDPRKRLTHLLELERGATPSELQAVPDDLLNTFFEVSRICRATDQFVSERNAANSLLLKAQSFERGQEISDEVRAFQASLAALRGQLLGSLKDLDAEWDQVESSTRDAALARLEEIRRLLGFYDRWIGQLQERFVQLAM
jgi:curved DNA-binding protein CbpA